MLPSLSNTSTRKTSRQSVVSRGRSSQVASRSPGIPARASSTALARRENDEGFGSGHWPDAAALANATSRSAAQAAALTIAEITTATAMGTSRSGMDTTLTASFGKKTECRPICLMGRLACAFRGRVSGSARRRRASWAVRIVSRVLPAITRAVAGSIIAATAGTVAPRSTAACPGVIAS